MDEYPPGVRAPGEDYTGPIADPDEAVRAAMASKDVLAQAAEYAADPDAPIKAYLSARDVWEGPWKYASYPRPEAAAPLRTPDASAPPPAQQASWPPAASPQPDPLFIPAQAREAGEDRFHLVRLLRNTTPQGYPAPVNPLGVFIPGTPENEAWVQGAGRAIDAVQGVIGHIFNSQSRDEETGTPDPPHGSGEIEGRGNRTGDTVGVRPLPPLPPNPDDLLAQGWKETSHPSAAEAGHRTFENAQTGEVIRFDKGRPGQPGFEGQDHYHRLNPNGTGRRDQYLDQDGNPVARGSDPSHLLPRS